MKRRKALSLAVIICIIAITAVGSIAYFTAKDSVTNTFMMSTYDPDNPDKPVNPDDIFSIKVYETENGTETTKGRTYTEIGPGDVLDKDPTVKNTGAYSQWVRVQVSISNADAWKKACDSHGITDLMKIFGGCDDSKWSRYAQPAEDREEDTVTYEFYLNEELKPGEAQTLFTTVIIPGEFNAEDMANLSRFEIKVSAEAIQSKGTGESAKEAFDKCWG